jgi:hypothetical protein
MEVLNMDNRGTMNVYFSDYFNVDPKVIEKYGAFNISLINDLPLFIDPFLLFESKKTKYQKLHRKILNYVVFLRDISREMSINDGLLYSWFIFSEVKQNWLGYSLRGNEGSGLGRKFALALRNNLNTIFSDFGNEKIAKDSHLEKLCIIESGVGRDNISDFTVNLIKEFLCEYTQNFARKHVNPSMRKKVSVEKVIFDKNTKRWKPKVFDLPVIKDDFILLTPKDILTKDENWINNRDLFENYSEIANSIPNEQLRSEIDLYFRQNLPRLTKKKKTISKSEYYSVVKSVIFKYPEILNYYIKYKEDNGEKAISISKEDVKFVENVFIENVSSFIKILQSNSAFYNISYDTYQESLERVRYLKQVIENNDGYKLFYVKGEPIKREKDLQIMFRLTWFSTASDVNSEVDNGRGPVDFKISRGNKDKTLVEFKLASNTKLKQNLQHQLEIYQKANQTDKGIKVILFFSSEEESHVYQVLDDLKLQNKENIILIDARRDNKKSASTVK